MSKERPTSWVVKALADATGRTDEEAALLLTVGVVVAGLTAAFLTVLHLLNLLEDLDVYVFGPRKQA